MNPFTFFPQVVCRYYTAQNLRSKIGLQLHFVTPQKKIHKDLSDAWNGPVNPEKIEGEPVEFSNNIKKISRFLGANLVGICELDKRWVYEDAEVPHEYAISMAVEMESELLLNEPSYLENTASGIAYSKARYVSVILAQFIRGIGYNAYANVNESPRNPHRNRRRTRRDGTKRPAHHP